MRLPAILSIINNLKKVMQQGFALKTVCTMYVAVHTANKKQKNDSYNSSIKSNCLRQKTISIYSLHF